MAFPKGMTWAFSNDKIMATRERIKKGFSKLLKEEKLKLIANYFENPGEVVNLLKSYWHPDSKQQQLFDEFSENTITKF